MELLPWVDRENRVIMRLPRYVIHNFGLIHRESFAYFRAFDSNYSPQVLLSRRKDNGKWDHSVAEHVHFGEEYEEASLRGIEEELGIVLDRDNLQLVNTDYIENWKLNLNLLESYNNRRHASIHVIEPVIGIEDINSNPEDVLEVDYFRLSDIVAMLEKDRGMPAYKQELTSDAAYVLERHILPYFNGHQSPLQPI